MSDNNSSLGSSLDEDENNKIVNNISINNNNIFSNISTNNYEDNSKYIDLGKNFSVSNPKPEDIWNDPFNPKWYQEDISSEKDYDKIDINYLNQKIQNYIEDNKGRKNYLEYCDNNSQTLNAIKNFELDLDNSF